MLVTSRLNRAIQVAAHAHRNHTRKGANIPYITHPYAVMLLASSETDDEDTLIGCLFHDILEDVPEMYSKEDMHREFGDRVVSIVEGVTKDDTIDSWQERSDAYIAHLRHKASRESVIVSAADKYHNLLSIVDDYEQVGDVLWDRFNAGKERQLWWYEAVGEVLQERIPESILTKQYFELLEGFEHTTKS